MTSKTQRIRDPLHNLIEFDASEFESAMWQVIKTRPYQRLRRIKQLGFSDFVFPGATHSRLAHSVGVFHTARQLMNIIRRYLGDGYLETRAHAALAAALVHDLGHGPFSHAFEKVGKKLNLRMAQHELVSDALIRTGPVAEALNVLGSGFATDVADIINSDGPQNIYAAVVSSQFDADRLDYMRRDRLMTGTQHAAIDFEWLISNLEVGKVKAGVDESPFGEFETFVLGPKAVFAAEAYVLGLFQLYPTVYLHKTTRGIEKLFVELILRTIKLVRAGHIKRTGLTKRHSLVRFALSPDDVDRALELDDTTILGSLSLLVESPDDCIKEAATRIRDRELFKAIDVREVVKIKLGLEVPKNEHESRTIDVVCAKIQQSIERRTGGFQRRHPDKLMPILLDHDEREPYKKFQLSKGPLNQIRIKLPSGDLVDLSKRSKVVRSIESFKLDRAYVRNDDSESRTFVEKVIEEEVRNAKGR